MLGITGLNLKAFIQTPMAKAKKWEFTNIVLIRNDVAQMFLDFCEGLN